jgi:hypothetical protein
MELFHIETKEETKRELEKLWIIEEQKMKELEIIVFRSEKGKRKNKKGKG